MQVPSHAGGINFTAAFLSMPGSWSGGCKANAIRVSGGPRSQPYLRSHESPFRWDAVYFWVVKEKE